MVVPSYKILSSVTKKVAESQNPLYRIDGRYFQSYTGHSMGAPMIAGALALMKEYNKKNNKGYSTKDLVRILKQTADKTFKGYDSSKHGVGMLDVKAALEAIRQ
jgi:subtilase family serine protease